MAAPLEEQTGAPLSIAELADLYVGEVDEAWKAKEAGRLRGPITRLKALDRALGGFLAPGLYVLHGEPGSGKSALALQIAVDCEFSAMYVTTEMQPLELLRRIVARVVGKPRSALLSGFFSRQQEAEMVQTAVNAASHLMIYDALSEPVTAWYLKVLMAGISKKMGHGLLVVDSLHSWAAPLMAQGQTEYESLNRAMADLRSIASQAQVPVIVVAERNRSSMKAGGLSAVAGTRRVEYGADAMLELSFTDDDGSSGVRRIDLKISKNRNGPAGVIIPLRFSGDQQSFHEVYLERA